MLRTLAAVSLAVGLAGCGGVASAPSQMQSGTTAAANPAPSSPAVVNVSGGQSATGVDITVLPPASVTPPNAEDLGVAQVIGIATAANTGGIIHRGSTERIVLFGAGLTGDMTATVRGNNDVIVEALSPIVASDGTPGLSFLATINPNAALGCRTVVLTSPRGDVTTFTGGLEIVP